MKAAAPVEELIGILRRRFGAPTLFGSSRLFTFANAFSASINYSKCLHGSRFFFGLSREVVDPAHTYPMTASGEFVLLICGSPESTLVLPRDIALTMMAGVSSRRLDIYLQEGRYVLQTTGHPKLDVTPYLNAFPASETVPPIQDTGTDGDHGAGHDHVNVQWALIRLGRAEGCSVWVPPGDRHLSVGAAAFAELTIDRLPNFGFEENSRRIISNIDVLWLANNVIRKAFEIEATTSVYSGLLRMNDLVLSQPNSHIDLHIVASASRRDRVAAQLLRPSFRALIESCRFVSFEQISSLISTLEAIPLDQGARVSGLIRGERLEVPDYYVYPTGL